MIKHIIHTADIHIRNHRRMEEYQTNLQWFIEKCKEFCSNNNPDETRIVITGDLFHSKSDLSPECYTMGAWFLRELDGICKTILIAGNHDITDNTDRLDPLTAMFSMCKFKQVYYLDKELEYQSGCIVDDNIVWCLYSVFDNFSKPNIDEIKISNPDKTYVALYHGDIISARTDAGYQSMNGLNASYFDGVDFGLFGHIHKRQTIKYEGIPLVYCGSLIQQDHGENMSSHGFLVWDTEEVSFSSVENENKEYGYYTFKIDDIEDLEMDDEEIINL